MYLNFVRGAVLGLLVSIFASPLSFAEGGERPVVIGQPNAPVSIDLYYSFACPHCLHILDQSLNSINAAVNAGNLRIRYFEIPGALTKSTKDSAEAFQLARSRSRFLSQLIECYAQEGDTDTFRAAQNALPDLLRSFVGSTRTLALAGAPDEYVDWHFWPWAEIPDDSVQSIAQLVVNETRKLPTNCVEAENVAAWNARTARLRNLGKGQGGLPELEINGEFVPSGDAFYDRLGVILQNADVLSKVLQADIDLETMQLAAPHRFSGLRIEEVDHDLKDVKVRGDGDSHYISFGPERPRISKRSSEIASFSAAPLLEFLFFGSKASVIAEIHAAPTIGADHFILLTDLTGSQLRVTLRANRITSIAYQGSGEDGFTFAMEP